MNKIKVSKGCRMGFCILVLAVHFVNAAIGFYIPFSRGDDILILLSFLCPPVLLALNSLNAYCLYCGQTSSSLRRMALIIKLITDLLLLANLLFFIFGVALMGLFLTVIMGPLSLIGVGMASVTHWWYSSLCCLSGSAYMAAYIWQSVRENRMNKSTAILHTVLQFLPFVSFVDAIVVFRLTRERKE